MAKRKPISKKLRFEVFKRDKFTCQYCGRKSPDVILEVDHIEPVAKGGTNEITNLVTACRDCNRGKSARKLSDDSVVKKEQRQTEQLAQRREQIDMYFKWQEELLDQDMKIATQLAQLISKKWGFEITDAGVANLNQWIKKYGIHIMTKAADISFKQYEDHEKAFKMLPRVAFYQLHPISKEMQQFYYMRGILRNRVFCNDRYLFKHIQPMFDKERAIPDVWDPEDEAGWHKYLDAMVRLAKICKNWTDFRVHFEENWKRGELPDEPID